MKTELSIERVKELLDYEPETGKFYWKVQTSNSIKIGEEAGGLSVDGYRRLRIDGVLWLAHRLSWFVIYGSFPKTGLDHINGIRTDNRIENLREAENSLNSQNRKTVKGYTYVSKRKKKPWLAQIKINYKNKGLGYFETAEEAHEAYLAAKRKHHPFFVEEEHNG